MHPADPVRLANVHLSPFHCLLAQSNLLVHQRRGPSALRNDGVERVAEHPAGTAVKAADVGEVPGIPEILFYEPHVAPVVQLVPDLDRLRGETTIGEGNDQWASNLEHPTDFAQHLHGSGKIVDGDADPDPVELRLSERQFGVYVQVLDFWTM